MGIDDGRRRRIAKFAMKVGKVATAAAALLAESTASAHDSDLLRGILNRNDAVAAVSRGAEEPARLIPPPLILQPSHADPDLMLAGHRSHSSHSSHSSHRSHVSGSGHASHFSSSVGTGSGTPPSISDGSSPEPAPPTRPVPPSQVKPALAPKVVSAPAVDLNNPLNRYRLIALGTYSRVEKAFIKDQQTGVSKLLEVGEKIGDCQLVAIVPEDTSVRLKPSKGPEFTIYRTQPVR